MRNNIGEIIKSIVFYTIIVLFVNSIIIAGYCILKLLYPQVDIGSYAEFLTALIALIALIVALLEYLSTKDSKKAQVFSEYNIRYSKDPNVTKVVKYLNNKADCKNNPITPVPSNYEVEMFMRFFEELQLQIKYGRLDSKDVDDLFVYYAKMLDKNEELRISLGITKEDYNVNWKNFKELVNKK